MAMARYSGFDIGFKDMNELEVLQLSELSDAAYAEELQLQEVLKESMTTSDKPSSLPMTPEENPQPSPLPAATLKVEGKGLGCQEAISQVIRKGECPVCHKLLCTQCSVPQRLGVHSDEQRRKYENTLVMATEPATMEEKLPRYLTPRTRKILLSAESTSSKGDEKPFSHCKNQDYKEKGIAYSPVYSSQNGRFSNVYARKSYYGPGSSAAKSWIPLKSSKDNNAISDAPVDEDTQLWPEKKDNIVHDDDNDDVTADASDASDDYDSDASQKSHETRKNSKWFKNFFEALEGMSLVEINEQKDPWHCPACQDGPGAIKWFHGLQDLIKHAKTKGARRVKLHRELAELLDEELRRKRTTQVTTIGQILGKWKGLTEEAKDHGIVWPPMVVIMNTCIKNNEKWIGMGSQELIEYFRSYATVKAQHSYGPQGHRGVSVLVFESSVAGYLEAERLHRDMAEQGIGRNDWESFSVLELPTGERQLYGFMAVKKDLEIFNQHCQGKLKLKYEIKSYDEVVLSQIRKMSEETQQLIWLKDSYAEAQKHVSTLQESVENLTRKFHQRTEEACLLMKKIQLLHEQKKEEMDSQEEFYKDQIKNLEATSVEEHERLKQSDANPLQIEEHGLRIEESPICSNQPTMEDLGDEQGESKLDETAVTFLMKKCTPNNCKPTCNA